MEDLVINLDETGYLISFKDTSTNTEYKSLKELIEKHKDYLEYEF